MKSAGQAVPVLTQTGAEERSLRRHTQPGVKKGEGSLRGGVAQGHASSVSSSNSFVVDIDPWSDSADGSGEAVDLQENPSSLSETALIAEGENKADGELRSAGSVMRSAGQAVPVLTQTGAEERSLRRQTQPGVKKGEGSLGGGVAQGHASSVS